MAKLRFSNGSSVTFGLRVAHRRTVSQPGAEEHLRRGLLDARKDRGRASGQMPQFHSVHKSSWRYELARKEISLSIGGSEPPQQIRHKVTRAGRLARGADDQIVQVIGEGKVKVVCKGVGHLHE